MAGGRHDPSKWFASPRRVPRLRRRASLQGRRDRDNGAGGLHLRENSAGHQKTTRLSCLRSRLHPTASAGRHDGFRRGSLRRLLRLWPAPQRCRPGKHRSERPMTAQIDDRGQETLGPFGACPLPIFEHPQIVLGHGSGGKLSAELIEKVFVSRFHNPTLEKMDDQAVLEIGGTRLAFTTDSFVVTPIFFPGGDIGTLAVNGTVNDLAMGGARPLYLSAAFILEEGLAAT